METRDKKYEEISNPETAKDSNSECITENADILINGDLEENEDLETFDIVSDQQLELNSIKSFSETDEKVEKDPKEKEDFWDLWI